MFLESLKEGKHAENLKIHVSKGKDIPVTGRGGP
jgi:hypothetical protein